MQLFSVIIPTYNRRILLEQTLTSVWKQTFTDYKIIVIDDGSTDGSLEVIKRFGASIRCETGPNRGGNSTLSRLLELARGEWLQYVDADDYLLPGKIPNQMEFLAAHQETDIIFGPVALEHWSQTAARPEVVAIPEPTRSMDSIGALVFASNRGTIVAAERCGGCGGLET